MLNCGSRSRRSPDGAERNPGPIDELLCRSRISLRFIRATKKKEGKRNAGRRSVSCPARKRRAGRATEKTACAALTAVGRARLPAFHRGSHQGEYSIPKGQPGPGFVDTAPNTTDIAANAAPSCSEAPRTPVIVPAGMMPGQPGSGADEAPPAGTALAPFRPASPGRRPFRASLIRTGYVTETGTHVKDTVSVIETMSPGTLGLTIPG